MPSNKARRITLARRKASRVTDTISDTMPSETNSPADPATMLATPEQIAALTPTKTRKLKLGNIKKLTPAITNPAPEPSNDLLAGTNGIAFDSLEAMPDDMLAVLSELALMRLAAGAGIAIFYHGISLPFKAAPDLKLKSPINFNLRKNPSARSAGLLAAIITYCNVQPDGTFVRGSGAVPGKLLGYTGKQAQQTFAAGPESGGLSNCIPDRIEYVSGVLSGPGCENAVFKINFEAARVNMRNFNSKRDDGTHVFSAPLRLLRAIEKRGETAKPKPEPTFPDNISFADNPPANVTNDPNDPSVSDLPA